MAERNPLVEEWILKADRYPGFDTSREEVLERKEMAWCRRCRCRGVRG